MGPQAKTVGGGHARPLSNDWFDFLRSGLNTGTFGTSQMFGANPGGQTMGIAGVLNDLLSGGAGVIGGNMADMIRRQTESNAADLRARYGVGGGMGYGTPAAMAEAGYRAQESERLPVAIGQLQLQALQSLFPMYGQAAGIGTPQAQTIMQQNPFAGVLGTLAPVISSVAPYLQPNPFGSSVGTPRQNILPQSGTV